MKLRRPSESLAAAINKMAIDTPFFSLVNGRIPGRYAICECGTRFKQGQLHPAWMAHAAEKNPSIVNTFPDGWTPDVCPSCARKWNNATCEDHRVSPEGLFTPPEQARKPLHSIERPRREIEV